MELVGESPINSLLFYSGKICAWIAASVLFFHLAGFDFRPDWVAVDLTKPAIIVGLFGIGYIVSGILFLGTSNRVGLPTDKTKLKTNGIYHFSRNPIYVGIIALMLASFLITVNPAIAAIGIYAGIVQHMIILAEEDYLKKEFDGEYQKYAKRVRRYI